MLPTQRRDDRASGKEAADETALGKTKLVQRVRREVLIGGVAQEVRARRCAGRVSGLPEFVLRKGDKRIAGNRVSSVRGGCNDDRVEVYVGRCARTRRLVIVDVGVVFCSCSYLRPSYRRGCCLCASDLVVIYVSCLSPPTHPPS